MCNYDNSNPQIRNTIFWGNTAPTGAQIYNCSSTPVVSDSVVQGGYPRQHCTNIITTDPLLGTLGNYGGFTQTIPLLAGSSAIDTGNDAVCPATDQRGVTRPQGAHCDIGAFEQDDFTPPRKHLHRHHTVHQSQHPHHLLHRFGYCRRDRLPDHHLRHAPCGWRGRLEWYRPHHLYGRFRWLLHLYPWAKDAVGNVSAVFASPRAVGADTTAPTVNTFTVTTLSTSLNIPITSFTASDTVGVTGYLITTSATAPAAGAGAWSGTAPTTYTVASDGPYTL